MNSEHSSCSEQVDPRLLMSHSLGTPNPGIDIAIGQVCNDSSTSHVTCNVKSTYFQDFKHNIVTLPREKDSIKNCNKKLSVINRVSNSTPRSQRSLDTTSYCHSGLHILRLHIPP